jgi:hypothetical protein
MRKKFEKKKDKKLDKYIGEIKKLVKECKRELPSEFKTFFIDSDMEDIDKESIEECKRLVAWVASLNPLDTSKAKEVDDKIKESETITYKREGPSRFEKNIEYKTIITMEKKKNIHYDGSITYSQEKEISRKEERIEHKKEIINTRFEEKEEKESKWEGKKEIITTRFKKRKIITYNDGSVDEGNWEEYKSPKEEIKMHPKNLTNVKDEYRKYQKEGYEITESRKTRIFDDGSIEEGNWEIISRSEIPKPVEQRRKVEKTDKEYKTEEKDDFDIINEIKSYVTGFFFKDTHYYNTQQVIKKKKKLNMKELLLIMIMGKKILENGEK